MISYKVDDGLHWLLSFRRSGWSKLPVLSKYLAQCKLYIATSSSKLISSIIRPAARLTDRQSPATSSIDNSTTRGSFALVWLAICRRPRVTRRRWRRRALLEGAGTSAPHSSSCCWRRAMPSRRRSGTPVRSISFNGSNGLLIGTSFGVRKNSTRISTRFLILWFNSNKEILE